MSGSSVGGKGFRVASTGAQPTAALALDDVSKRIIEVLQEDGRMSYTRRSAKAVGLSEAAVRQRVQRSSTAGSCRSSR